VNYTYIFETYPTSLIKLHQTLPVEGTSKLSDSLGATHDITKSPTYQADVMQYTLP
jgi:hypothetical protein